MFKLLNQVHGLEHVWISYQVCKHEDTRYFSYKWEKVNFMTCNYVDEVERPHGKFFEETQASPPTENAYLFFRWEIYLPRSDIEL